MTSGVASLAIDAVIPGVVVAEATAPDELMPRGSDVESTDNKRRPPKRILAQVRSILCYMLFFHYFLLLLPDPQ